MENRFKNNDNVLLITNKDLVFEKTFIDEIIEKVGQQFVINVSLEELDKLSLNELSFDSILSSVQQIDDKVLTLLLNLLKPNSKLIIKKSKDCTTAQTISSLKLNGFVNINETIDEIVAQKPEYAIGSSVKLKLTDNKKSTTAKVWSLAADDIIDDSVELINDEELLNDEDRAKPNPESLKVCATTKQRKACANCSCGLAEELEKEAIDNIRKNTQNAKSSCGSCYLGDAFRCASCPYLGMPAFKPGQKVVLDNSSDI